MVKTKIYLAFLTCIVTGNTAEYQLLHAWNSWCVFFELQS